MRSFFLAKFRPTVFIPFVLLVAGLTATLLSSLRAQDDSGGVAPAPPPAAAAPMPDQNASNADTPAAPPAPEQNAPAADQGQGFTADDATGVTQGDASFQTFYDDLSNQGTWIQSNDYGYVWQPQVTDPNWAPYTQGHWAYSDDGWTWVSDEQFGWATYHYGRWANLDGYGWVWVPGYTWAPAWVSWRYGDGYAGWAPLPPDSFVGVDYSDGDYSADYGYHIGGDADSYYGIGAAYYIFLPVNCLGYHNYHGYYCDRNDNWNRINNTRNVTNINVSHRQGLGSVTENGGAPGRIHRVTAGGPQLADVNAASQTPIQKVTLAPTSQRGGGTINGNTLALYAPHVHAGSTGTPAQPSRVSGSITQARINHGIDISRPLTVNSHLAPPAATQAQVQQAHLAVSQAPASAKVITDESSVRPVLQKPLTTMRPVGTAAHTANAPLPGAATHSSGTPASPGYNPATHPNTVSRAPETAPPTPTYNPSRVYPQTGGNEVTPSRTYAPTQVYPTNPNYSPRTAPTEIPPQSRTYAPSSVYPSNPSSQPRSTPSESGGAPAAESHTYVRPSAPASTPPAAQESHAESRSAPAPAPSSGTSTAPASGTTSGGGTGNGRSH
jgi:hypothetical protein